MSLTLALRMRRLTLLVIPLGFLLLFQNCSEFTVNPMGAATRVEFGVSGGSELQPATDKLDPGCLKNASYDACLFYKNPVAQGRQPLTQPSVNANVESLQIYGVKLTGLSPSGRLENESLRIESVTGTPVVTLMQVKHLARGDAGHAFSQVTAYYWLQRTMEYVEARTGTLWSKGKGLRVYVDDTISGWSSRTNSIHLKLGDNGNPMAWSAELAIHFFGLAELHHASNGLINDIGPEHRDCGLKANGCCASQVGCAKAIASGVGDYYAAMMFPTQPVIGETWVNQAAGMGFCNKTRDLTQAANLAASQAYTACNADGIAGEATTMGTFYASIWWEVRKQARTFSSSGEKDIDTLFVSHLAVLNGRDTFQTALEKIKSLDSQKFGGIYSQLFMTELSKRGL